MRSKTSRGEGLVPRWGGGGAWQNPPCQFAVPSHNSSFSYLGVPAPAGIGDYYESMSRTPIRDALKPLSSAPLNPNIPRSRHSGASSIRHSREGGNPRTNIPRNNANRDTTTYVHTATPLRLPGESTPRTPIRRRNPEGWGWGNVVRGLSPARRGAWQTSPLGSGGRAWQNSAAHSGTGPISQVPTLPATTPAFHTLVCRPLPASAITMKACPGLRSGMRLNGLSSAPANPSIRHSREGGNPRTNIPRKNANRDTTTYVHTATPLCLSRKSTPRTLVRGRNPGQVEGAPMTPKPFQQPDLYFHTLVCRPLPASAITMKACPGFRSGMRSNGFRVRQRTPPFVIPSKAGIHALTSRERTPTAIPPPTSTQRPHFVSPAIARPVPRYETGIERRCMGGK